MAAREYYSNQPMTSSSYPHPISSQQPPIYHYNPEPAAGSHVQHGAPPPYEEHRPAVHFASAPYEIPQRHSFSGQQRPDSMTSHQYSHGYSQTPPAQMQQHTRPQPYPAQYQSGYEHGTPPKPQFLSPHMRPYTNPNSSQYSLNNGGYASDPEQHRRRHKRRSRKDSGESRSTKSSSRSKNADAFIGAAGGGLIGDLIFPGLGTVGGAALGWLGGKDYGSHRKDREDKRHKEQQQWEDRFHHHDHHRSRSYDRRRRDSSTDIGEYESQDRRSSRH